MYLRWVTSILILTSSIAFAQPDISTPLPKRAVSREDTHSRIRPRCRLPTEEEPDPPCHGPVNPPPPPDPSIHSYTINDPAIYTKPISVQVTVPDTISVDTYNDVLLTNLQTTLPITLKQLNVDAAQISALASEGVPLLVEAITAVQSGLSLPDTASDLVRRGFFSKIGRWIKKVVTAIIQTVIAIIEHQECAMFSALALPGYMIADVAFATINGFPINPGVSTTLDEDYFINPLNGPVSHDDNIRIFYDANFLPGFGAADAATFGKLIYVRGPRSATIANTPLLGDRAFRKNTKTILHEFQHVQQYRDLGYVNPLFGARYLFDYCTAGNNYTENVLEKEAYATQELVDGLLDDNIGTQFFDKWKNNNWAAPFGLPTKRNYTDYQGLPGQYYLPFENGGIPLVCNSARQCV
ncbi:MAG: hypothetical protein Q9170_005098 [Blastenia crenularia]